MLGDSHTALAVNDSIISNCLNMSAAADAYLYSYIKLQKFLEANKIDTVIVAYNFHSLKKETEKWVLDDKYLIGKMSHYFPYIDEQELSLFATHFSFYSSILKFPYESRQRFIKAFKNNLTYKDLDLGGFRPTGQHKLYEDINLKRTVTNSYNSDFGGKYQMLYLDKIVRLCKDKNVQLIFLNVPVYSLSKQSHDINKYYSYYKEYYSDIPLFDYSNISLPDRCFRDIDHLNRDGAAIFSNLLKNDLKNNNKEINNVELK